MSLNISTLNENLVQAFQSMKDGDDSVFAKKVSEAVANHIKTGNITTVDAGTVPVGAFMGAGTGAMTVDASILEGVLLAACKSMAAMSAGGDSVLAAQLAAGMDAMTYGSLLAFFGWTLYGFVSDRFDLQNYINE